MNQLATQTVVFNTPDFDFQLTLGLVWVYLLVIFLSITDAQWLALLNLRILYIVAQLYVSLVTIYFLKKLNIIGVMEEP